MHDLISDLPQCLTMPCISDVYYECFIYLLSFQKKGRYVRFSSACDVHEVNSSKTCLVRDQILYCTVSFKVMHGHYIHFVHPYFQVSFCVPCFVFSPHVCFCWGYGALLMNAWAGVTTRMDFYFPFFP
jgi:hypothetical protein